jgi:flagellar motor protein MotB
MFTSMQRAHEAQIEAERKVGEVQRAKGARLENAEALIDKVQRQLSTLRTIPGVEFDGRNVRLPVEVLFALNSDELQPAGRQLLVNQVAPVLKSIKREGSRLVVSGYADATQMHSKKFGNWSLSARRAANVVVTLLDATGLPEDSIVAVGYGDTRPLPGIDPTDARNRRVELSVSVEVADLLAAEGK